MEWLKVFLLGIVEGTTEFLPISSTGHLIVATDALNLQTSSPTTFNIFIQIGAIIAVVLYYSRDLIQQVRQVPRDKPTQHFWLSILIACVPAAVLVILIGDQVDALLEKPAIVGITLIIGGVLFIIVERTARFQAAQASTPEEQTTAVVPNITFRQAFIIGCCQLIAVIPGMSRSGMSILGGIFAGLTRPTATQFSFYLAIPTLGGATVYALLKNLDAINSQDLGYLIFGAIVAGIVAWFSIAWLLRYIAHHSFMVFGVYRIIAGGIILLLVFLGAL